MISKKVHFEIWWVFFCVERMLIFPIPFKLGHRCNQEEPGSPADQGTNEKEGREQEARGHEQSQRALQEQAGAAGEADGGAEEADLEGRREEGDDEGRGEDGHHEADQVLVRVNHQNQGRPSKTRPDVGQQTVRFRRESLASCLLTTV